MRLSAISKSAPNSIVLHLNPDTRYEFGIDWGDGTPLEQYFFHNSASPSATALTHTYAQSGVYDIGILPGIFPGLWNYSSNVDWNQLSADSFKFNRVKQWGPRTDWSGGSDFANAYNLTFPVDKQIVKFKNATNMDLTFGSMLSTVYFPPIDVSNATSFRYTWQNNRQMISFPSIDTSKATNLLGTWGNCVSLTSMPWIDTDLVTEFSGAWGNCVSLTSVPLLSVQNGINFQESWLGCTSLTSMPPQFYGKANNLSVAWHGCSRMKYWAIANENSTSAVNNFGIAWRICTSLTAFPWINTQEGVWLNQAWDTCTSLSSFPLLNTPKAIQLQYAWYNCSSLTAFPSINFPVGQNFNSTWYNCKNLSAFPAIYLENGLNFGSTWSNCERLREFWSLTALSATTFNNAWYQNYELTGFGALLSLSAVNFDRTWYQCRKLTNYNFYPTTFAKMSTGKYCFKEVTLPTSTWTSILTSISASNRNTCVLFDGGYSKRDAFGSLASNIYLALPLSEGGRGWTILDGGPVTDFAVQVNIT